MEILYLLESIRNPILDTLMLIFTEFGNELLFIAAGLVTFWCIDKKQGYFILLTGFFGVYINQFLKITCRIPRPWVLDPSFTIVEAAREAATGYSFPSGHTQTAVGCYGALAVCRKETWVRVVSVILVLLVPFTRMYLGVHTPLDVGVSIVIALALILLLWPLCNRYGTQRKLMYPMMGVLTAMGIAFMLYVTCYPFPADVDAANLSHAVENAYKFLGCALGMWVIYEADERFIHFDTKTARWWAQILKLLLGLAVVLCIKSGTKPLLNLIFGGHGIAHTIRYLLTVLAAGFWPMTFKWFGKMGMKK
jgi:undecaprenyl-diphosphatase